MARGYGRPPLWAVIAMVAGLVILAVGIPIALARSRANDPTPSELAAASAADRAAAAAAIASESARAAEPRLLIVGDSYTAGTPLGGLGAANWTQLVARQLHDQGQPVVMTVSAQSGAGYVKQGGSGGTFLSLAQASAGAPYALVVVFGSRNDANHSGVQDAATAVYGRIKATSPRARLLVVGPPWVNDTRPASILAVRDAVAAAARSAGATFVDPLADGWFGGSKSALIGSDGIHPTDAGHAYLAGLLGPKIAAELKAAGAAGK